jgi:hypothetical protein
MKYLELPYPEQKKAVLLDLNKFVKHSEIVYKNAKYVTATTYSITDEIHQVKNYIYEINKGKDLFTICLLIFRLKKRLYKILPHVLNPSYENQFKKLTDLIEFATNYIKPKVLINT